MKKVIAACCLFLLYASARVGAQIYPATLQVPIDIFDYHSDGSCPDFNPGAGVPNVWLTHLVQDTLDQDGLPVRGTAFLYSWELGKWWRQWRQGNDYERPVYATGGRSVTQLQNAPQITYDTSYKNILVRQNLPFTYIAGSQGQYQYQNGAFFPLDNAGFQANGNPPDPTRDVGGNLINRATNLHNYSFATHIHRIFKYVNGTTLANQLIFEFRGDDDLWVFINSHLVLDLGGIHTTIHGSFVLANGNAVVWENFKNNDMSDTMTAPTKLVVNLGLKDSSTAAIDVFFCERQSTGSDIEVTSNIITAPPQTLSMQTIPATDTIAAGETMQMFATILDDTGGVRPEYANLVTWVLLPTGTRSSIKTTQGGFNTFYAVDAYKWYNIIGTFVDPTNPGRIILDTVKVYVVPAAPSHLTIEASPVSATNLNADNRLGSITFPSSTQMEDVYAVLRDRFGNFVSYATLAAWVSDNTAVVTVAPGNTSLGQGAITRQTNQTASTYVSAAQNGWTDSVQVILSNVTYSQIQIVGRLTGTSAIDSIASLQMRTDQDTTLWALGLEARTDGVVQWDQIQVMWGNTAGMSFNNGAPTNANSWSFQPLTQATGKIFIVWGSGAQQRSDTITAIFNYGLPDHMALYPARGQPDVGTNVMYGPTKTVTAGQALPLDAALFSASNQWLSAFETDNAPITWTIQELTGATNTGTLNKYTGDLVSFTGYKATQTVKVTATFSNNGITISQFINITITAGPAAKLVIEPDTTGRTAYVNDPTGAHRAQNLGGLTIAGSATTVAAYAVLRDQYGNFVAFSNPTNWTSRADSIVVAQRGDMTFGQGIMMRETNVGQSWVQAQDSILGFTDSVLVVISNITYTALRIVVRDSTVITNLGMTIDMDTTLKVQGLRSDNQVWEYVKANWSATAGLQNATAAPGSSISWDIAPKDTGHAWIKVSLTGATPDSISVTVGAGVPQYIVLYPAEGAPGPANTAYPGPGQVIIDSAGKALPVVAKVFDKAGDWLSSFETPSSPVTWSIVELQGNTDVPTGTLPQPQTGDKTVLMATKANNTILVIAEFAQNGQDFKDSIKVTVAPGKPDHLSLEPSADAFASPHKDNPEDTVLIPGNATNAYVYAVIRDQYGNFISASQSTGWLSRDVSAVTVDDGQKSLGQGVITRSGVKTQAMVVATSLNYPGLTDSTLAVVLTYYYTALRIVDPNGNPITSLTMNTNQDTTLIMQGQRSDNGQWENVPGTWQTTSGLVTTPGAPSNVSTWTFSPDTPGTGTITVTYGTDTVTTKPYHLSATFTVGPPVSIETEILTPVNLRVAGDTIVAVTRIMNKDGLVPGPYCDSATYQNALGTGGRPNPTVDSVKMGTSMYECFQNGIDTVKYVLYYAPADPDSLEKVTVKFEGDSASSQPFTLHPGALARLSLEDVNGNQLDSINLNYPAGAQSIIAVGYDAYGNLRGPEISTWGTSGTLHAIDNPTDVVRVYYTSGSVKGNESGYIHATAIGIGGKSVSDSTKVTITGPGTTLISAVTEDSSGNGYLDHIILHFNKLTTFPPGAQIVITEGNGKYVLPVDSVTGLTSSTDSVFVVTLAEPKNGDPDYGIPETDWKPEISITGMTGVKQITDFTATDGAGPVIWSVTKTIMSPSDRQQDQVTVVLSEPIGTSGNDFSLATWPQNMILVWKDSVFVVNGVSHDTLVQVKGMLDSILGFYQVVNDSTITFYMTNGKDMTGRDYLSLVSDTNVTKLTDKGPLVPNPPVADNQKVQVIVKSTPARALIVVPNPSGPTFNRENPGVLNLMNQPFARDWVRQDGAGTVMTFKVSPASGETVTGYLMIYDAVGNLVISADSSKSTAGIIPASWTTGAQSTYDFDIYWNGSNGRGSKVASGVYRAVLFLKYASATGSRNSRLFGTVGIR